MARSFAAFPYFCRIPLLYSESVTELYRDLAHAHNTVQSSLTSIAEQESDDTKEDIHHHSRLKVGLPIKQRNSRGNNKGFLQKRSFQTLLQIEIVRHPLGRRKSSYAQHLDFWLYSTIWHSADASFSAAQKSSSFVFCVLFSLLYVRPRVAFSFLLLSFLFRTVFTKTITVPGNRHYYPFSPSIRNVMPLSTHPIWYK